MISVAAVHLDRFSNTQNLIMMKSSARDIIRSDIDESQWYEALLEEDCKRVMKLLNDNCILWKLGWESEPSRLVKRSRLNQTDLIARTPRPWKGRSALHVGARRGCVELVKQVLELCSKENEEATAKTRENISPRAEIPPVDNCKESVIIPEIDEDKLGLARDTVAHWREQVSRKKVLQRARSLQLARWRSKQKTRVEDLILLRDGEYKLDAIAMASLNGNADVLTVLLDASVDCKTIPELYGLRKMPPSKDEDHGLAVILHAHESRKTESSTSSTHIEVDIGQLGIAESKSGEKEKLSMAMAEAIKYYSSPDYPQCPVFRACLKRYEKHRDFNFLPINEYLFHFLFADCFKEIPDLSTDSEGRRHINYPPDQIEDVLFEVLDGMWMRAISLGLGQFLSELHDGQGRAPFHVAVDEGTVSRFSIMMSHQDETITAIKALDGLGRTALHRAITLGKDIDAMLDPITPQTGSEFRDVILNQIHKSSCADALRSRSRSSSIVFDVDKVSRRNGFEGLKRDMMNSDHNNSKEHCTPIHSAIIHKRQQLLRLLLDRGQAGVKLWGAQAAPAFCGLVRIRGESEPRQVDVLELATLVGDLSIVTELIRDYNRWSKQIQGWSSYTVFAENTFPPLHVAAAAGDYELLKLLLEHGHYEPFIEDSKGNTPLHHATKGVEVEFHTHLRDFGNCQQILDSQLEREEEFERRLNRRFLKTEASIVERQGCINILLQAGCDMFNLRAKDTFEASHPGHEMSTNAKFLSWWYEKQAKEFAALQSTLSIAANAISVTAALVATASFVGPLQPPLNYDVNNQLQVGVVWVRMFTVCDIMSFYLAIAAIIFSLIPSLPMPQQSMLRELRRTRKMLTLAIAILLPSIIFILVAFGSSSMAVIHSRIGSWQGGGLTIGTVALGGLVCIVAIFLFFIRLLGFVFPRNMYIKKLYLKTSF